MDGKSCSCSGASSAPTVNTRSKTDLLLAAAEPQKNSPRQTIARTDGSYSGKENAYSSNLHSSNICSDGSSTQQHSSRAVDRTEVESILTEKTTAHTPISQRQANSDIKAQVTLPEKVEHLRLQSFF